LTDVVLHRLLQRASEEFDEACEAFLHATPPSGSTARDTSPGLPPLAKSLPIDPAQGLLRAHVQASRKVWADLMASIDPAVALGSAAAPTGAVPAPDALLISTLLESLHKENVAAVTTLASTPGVTAPIALPSDSESAAALQCVRELALRPAMLPLLQQLYDDAQEHVRLLSQIEERLQQQRGARDVHSAQAAAQRRARALEVVETKLPGGGGGSTHFVIASPSSGKRPMPLNLRTAAPAVGVQSTVSSTSGTVRASSDKSLHSPQPSSSLLGPVSSSSSSAVGAAPAAALSLPAPVVLVHMAPTATLANSVPPSGSRPPSSGRAIALAPITPRSRLGPNLSPASSAAAAAVSLSSSEGTLAAPSAAAVTFGAMHPPPLQSNQPLQPLPSSS